MEAPHHSFPSNHPLAEYDSLSKVSPDHFSMAQLIKPITQNLTKSVPRTPKQSDADHFPE
jgi:hypothetical protein